MWWQRKFFMKKAASAALLCAENTEDFNFAASNQATGKSFLIKVFSYLIGFLNMVLFSMLYVDPSNAAVTT
ncbi:hypothetical protein E0H88_07090 [Acinetobacter sp. ANC 4216]|uniref:hypothetical protein n=1 Tax=Acinetobacter TaxID=469 RepID=UPI000B8A28D0|nr:MULTISPECIES: hypothetical protein [Acinetobacter]TCB70671.1 hypothetical protein E0H88_07090 [Acinetobacter sp. ANC 4216]